ncbi:MAG: thrombospondin type 3 repeat:Cna B-type, partial [Planctomycetota bacterium]|nr:thrombospondin type 3 repeat:Cna B-type [Planctomycetota bacterium]
MRDLKAHALVALLFLGSSSAAQAGLITFDNLGNGEIVSEQYASMGVHIRARNFHKSHDLALTFDSLLTGTADTDLEGPSWATGNIQQENLQ